jgi:hypothetical protein
MTATAITYIDAGFAIAADGRRRWGHDPTRDGSTRDSESDEVQKIFEIAGSRMTLAYTVRGHVANRDRTFDVTVELSRHIASLRGKRFWNCCGFIRALSDRLEQTIEQAKTLGRLEDYPATEICFVGYFKGNPCWVDVQFRPYRNYLGSLYEMRSQDLYPGYFYVSGSPVVTELIRDGDTRVADFWKPPDDSAPLKGAAELVKGYVEACCSEWALALDPENCKEIGGHVHVATVTPPDRSVKSRMLKYIGLGRPRQTDFQWVVRPRR